MKTGYFIRRLIACEPWYYAANACCWLLFHTWPLIPGLIARALFESLARGGQVVVALAVAAVAAGAFRGLVVLTAALTGVPYRFSLQSILQRNVLAAVLARPGARALPGPVGDAISTLRDDVAMTLEGVDLTFDAAAGLLFAVGSMAVLLAVDWQVTVLVFLPVVLVVAAAQAARTRAVRVREESRAATARLTGAVGEVLGAVQVFQVARAEERAVAYLRRLSDARERAVLRDGRLGLTLAAVFESTAGLGAGLVLIVAAGKLAAGSFTVGDLALFSAYLMNVADFTGFLGYLVHTYRQAGVSLARLVALMQGAPAAGLVARRLPVAPAPALAARAAARLQRLEVRGLTCVHPESGRGVFDISFTLERGSFTVITGRIGSGKTTLVRALLGLLETQAGEVRWNGAPVAEPGRFFVPPRAAYTPQVPGLLSASVRENILLGVPEDHALDRAIHSAVLEDDVAAWPQGLQTPIGARGMKLSGGQVQRTAAARMFVRDAELLIFDDPSGALDAHTEEMLWERTRQEAATYLVVSNRPGALALADQVLHLEDGRLTG
ncbi:MAG TPA: ABC transporter ATP-binding protein [Symbiobacteriaceae bacterium]|nr:ABC transporter ATP-binding protein [Symbiobacteriaceae bacterium]